MSTTTIDEVYDQAKRLSPAEQKQLFNRLLQDMTPEPPNTFHDEAELEQLLLEGIQSGPATPLTDEDWQDIRQEVRARAAHRHGTTFADA